MRQPACATLFDTAIGRCGIAWRGEAVCAIGFPADGDRRCLAWLRRACGDLDEAGPSASMRVTIARLRALLAGEDVDLGDVAVDLGAATDFELRVYAETRMIRRGETRTYGEIADALGDREAARAVGRALGRNPVPIIVPCHRVLAAGGRTGGFSGAGGVPTKLRLLRIEGARIGEEPSLFDHVGMTA